MMDYDTFNSIISYLNNNQLEELRLFLEIEKQNIYLKNARHNLTQYLRKKVTISEQQRTPFCGYLDDNRLLITNYISAYILNSDEILSDYRVKKLAKEAAESDLNKKIVTAKNAFDTYENKITTPLDHIVEDSNWSTLYGTEEKIVHVFNKENFNNSRIFLGDSINYNLCSDISACFADSEKGKGLIMGLKK